jgi:hypothetical protein
VHADVVWANYLFFLDSCAFCIRNKGEETAKLLWSKSDRVRVTLEQVGTFMIAARIVADETNT